LPKVSAIIPTYNGARYIAETIQSALHQTYRDCEVLVVDDGSTDDTPKVVGLFGDKVRYFRKSNGGPGSARNFGIQQAQGEYIALLDHDDLWLPDRLERQVPILDSRPEVGLVYSDASLYHDDSNQSPNTCFGFYPPYSGKVFKKLFEGNFVPNLTVLVRRECFEKLGLFDESGRMMMTDDYHMWLRIAAHYEFTYVPRPLGKFRLHRGNLSRDDVQMILDTRVALEDICRRYPQLVGSVLRRKRFAELSYKLGKNALSNHKLGDAMREFKASVGEYPLFWKALVLLTVVLVKKTLG